MRKSATSLLSLLCASITCAFCATPEESSIVKAISSANILKSDYRVAVAIKGDEAIISAYLNQASRNAKTDIKIEAILLAQKTMSTSAHITRVKTRFYDVEQTAYREVSVTTGDVAAFANGTLTQDKLLASLDINTVPLQTATPQSQPKTAAPTKPQTKPATARPNLYKAQGLAFYYPTTWVQKQVPEEGEQARLISTAARGDATIVIRTEQTTPVSAAQRDRQSWTEMNTNGAETQAQLGWNQSIQLGYSRKIEGVDLLVQFTKGTDHTLERHVYFKLSPSSLTYHLSLRCSKGEFLGLNKEFAAVLATVLPAQ